MNSCYRIEVHPKNINEYFKFVPHSYLHIPIYWIYTEETIELEKILSLILNPLNQKGLIKTDPTLNYSEFPKFIEKKYLDGVTDNLGQTVKELILNHYPIKNLKVQSGELFFYRNYQEKQNIQDLINPLIHQSIAGKINDQSFTQRFENITPPKSLQNNHKVEMIALDQDIDQVMELNHQRLWALHREELLSIQNYYQTNKVQNLRKELGLPHNPTDVEMEVIAQTWSEHCKHKIFNSSFNYSERNLPTHFKKFGEIRIENLFKETIQRPTYEIIRKRKLDWAISLFKDNAGIVRFDPHIDVCFKVETHNSPSALDPYGGAITGILGVNRDILGCGMGAKPIANTDVFCVADDHKLRAPQINWPTKLFRPKQILKGIHAGVRDGGNKSGIPTVNGSIYYHDQYAGKPLVYCGTVGVLPQKIQGKSSSKKYSKPGDKIVMLGGRIGKDGIHGATFSSLELTDEIPPSVVQLGDPFTQKRMTDFLLKARDELLYTGITDNGAGGLSSSIGEMAHDVGGAVIDLSKAPTKYPGLTPYELMISESQERMSLSVAAEKIETFLELAKTYRVEASVLGEFTSTGYLDIRYQNECVGYINLKFLHNEFLPYHIHACFDYEQRTNITWHGQNLKKSWNSNLADNILELLASPNIRSKEKYVREYDHEVQASNFLKPFAGPKQMAPNNNSVISLKNYGGDIDSAIVISSGIQPLMSQEDPYLMALWSVDEAVRNAICSGVDPHQMAILDNFCWPDPITSPNNPDGDYKAASLVRACLGLKEACEAYGLPLISGKDSMKNDFIGKLPDNKNIKISILPTLLISLIGKHHNPQHIISSYIKDHDSMVALISPYSIEDWSQKLTRGQLGELFDVQINNSTPIQLEKNWIHYQKCFQSIQDQLLLSCHDISEGGFISALCEKFMGSDFGFSLDLNNIISNKSQVDGFLFNEITGSFLISFEESRLASLQNIFEKSLTILGKCQAKQSIDISFQEQNLVSLSLDKIESAWRTYE